MTRIERTTDTKALTIAYNDDTTDGYQTIVGVVHKRRDARYVTSMLPREYCYKILDVRQRSSVTCMIDGTKARIEHERLLK